MRFGEAEQWGIGFEGWIISAEIIGAWYLAVGHGFFQHAREIEQF